MGSATAAQEPCTYDAVFHRVAVDATGDVDGLKVGPAGELLHNDQPCGEATVSNTDLISVSGNTSTVVLRLEGGPFAPGFTPESSGTSEIEISLGPAGGADIEVVGTLGADRFALGTGNQP
jgi:hypothetical protein